MTSFAFWIIYVILMSIKNTEVYHDVII